MMGHGDIRAGRLKVYGRRVGPKLRAAQARRVEGAGLALDLASQPGLLAEPQRLFENACRSIWLEIGFGGGEHLISQAIQNPGVGLIGCEVFLNGVAKALATTERENLGNIRLHHGDAREIVDLLGDATVDRVFLLYPDPWPKRRHWKRRFVNAENLAGLHRVLRPGGELYIASDVASYIAWTLAAVHGHGGFEWCALCARDWRQRPGDWQRTRYEEKAVAAGRRPSYLRFRRLPD